MKDYTCYAILESANLEIIEQFVTFLKQMDSAIAMKRLIALVNSDQRKHFSGIASEFNALFATKTSAD